MSHDSLRRKEVVKFPNGKMMFFCEISDSSLREWNGNRIWEKALVHPKGTLFYTAEVLKEEQTKYVEDNLKSLREFNRRAVETGWADRYEEPTVDDINYAGTVFPNGRKIRDGRSFYSCKKTIDAAEYFGRWDSPKTITFTIYDKDFKELYKNYYDILAVDVDEAYQDALEEGKKLGRPVYISLH